MCILLIETFHIKYMHSRMPIYLYCKSYFWHECTLLHRYNDPIPGHLSSPGRKQPAPHNYFRHICRGNEAMINHQLNHPLTKPVDILLSRSCLQTLPARMTSQLATAHCPLVPVVQYPPKLVIGIFQLCELVTTI